ncbi:MAG: peptidoglycan-associated lipoprotein Pal [Rhodobacteraceae bacterium]|nr:peptidoglycan-associated lipoprotein Pal [Paracoccaceae bacterium]
MTLRLAAILISGALVLAGCAGAPNDNMRNTGSDNTGVYQQDSPEFFVHQVGDRVHFAVDQSTLSAEAMSILDAQAAWLGQNGEFSALIEGHADEQGTREYNLALGARRAAAAKDYLVSKGVAGGRLRTISYGKERPIEICSTEDCWSRNRRAVTVVSAGSS